MKQNPAIVLPLFVYLFRQKRERFKSECKKQVNARGDVFSEGMTLYQKLQATTLVSDKTKWRSHDVSFSISTGVALGFQGTLWLSNLPFSEWR